MLIAFATHSSLVIHCRAEDQTNTPGRQRGITHTRTVNLGTGRSDEGPAAGRTASEREEADEDDQGNTAMGGAGMNRNVRTRPNNSFPTRKVD